MNILIKIVTKYFDKTNYFWYYKGMIKRFESGISAKAIGFEYLSWIKSYALKAHLLGTVFEKNDGSIKIIAEGEDTDLNELAKKLENSNFLFPMENFYVKWEKPKGDYKDFSISLQH